MILRRVMLCTNDKRGSVVLETAITFTITLVFICSIISVIVFMRTDILMQRSFDQACEQTALLPPLSIPLSDAVSTLVNAFPDLGIGKTKGAEVLKKAASVIGGIDIASGYTLENLILEGTLAHNIANNIRSGYVKRNNGSDFFVPDLIDVDIRLNGSLNVMEISCTYQILTLAGRIERRIYSSVPMYGNIDLTLIPSDKGDGSKDIWSEDNFTRGDFFREEGGSNLPKTFPVIDTFENGTASSTYSMDLTSPYYSSEKRVTSTIKGEIDKMADFEGADVMINKKRYTIRADQITDRVLKIVIPGNSDDTARARVEAMSEYAGSRGVRLDIVEYGNSSRYQKNDANNNI